MLGVWNAYSYWRNPSFRILHQGESDKTAFKTSRDTQNVLRHHPWTQGLLPDGKGTVENWWVNGATDLRNASMYARGILSNITSARADECQNDDVEASGNVATPEAREKLRHRLGEQVHVMVPGAKQLFVGTPHHSDSLYDEYERNGADCLTIKMFEQEHHTADPGMVIDAGFNPEYVFVGIGKGAKLLVPDIDYIVTDTSVHFYAKPAGLVDCYAGCAWPKRFTRDDLQRRRRSTRTHNEWTSQYQLHSKPVGEIRLDPTKIREYNDDTAPYVLSSSNREAVLTLGSVRIIGAKARWDCSLGKITSDASAFALILTDSAGALYWHVAEALTGDIDQQCSQVRELVLKYHIPSVTVETNGPGGFVPPILRKHLRGITCGVVEDHASTNKNQDILDAFEAPMSIGLLWAHSRVLDGPMYAQMADFNPAVKHQPDDYLDSGARAIRATPVRIGNGLLHKAGIAAPSGGQIWRPSSGLHEVTLEA